MKFKIDEIWIDDEVLDYDLTWKIVERSRASKTLIGNEYKIEARRLALQPDPFKRGKRIIRLMRHKGAFVKPCPGTKEYICCNLEIIHIGQGCPMDCRYCALQFYFNRPVIEIFVNQDELFKELNQYLDDSSQPFHRFCTGEFTDSLALDYLTDLSSRLVDFFKNTNKASLEIKTKTNSVEPLKRLKPRGNVVVSFSLNSNEVSIKDEIRAATLNERLVAASVMENSGYRLGFHFDPIIPLGDWKHAYTKTISGIFDNVSAESIAWISLGVIRFQPVLKDIVTSRFGPVAYFHEAFTTGLDGKSRLFIDRRVDVYRFMAETIRKRSPDAKIYLCMESTEVWEKSLGITMNSNEQLSRYLDQAFTNRP